MKTLQLIIKREHFDNILSGDKKKEYREIRPTTEKKYIRYSGDPENPDVEPIAYDAIQFYVGYNKNRPSALVKVTSAEIEILTDEDGNDITYNHEDEIYVMAQIAYTLGEIVNINNV